MTLVYLKESILYLENCNKGEFAIIFRNIDGHTTRTKIQA